jgi:hypothetical protein
VRTSLGGVLEVQQVVESLPNICRSGEAFGLSSCVKWAGVSYSIWSGALLWDHKF